MKAMILAAGLGTRLQPYSLLRPKPLFPVLDRPLLQMTIARLKRAGFSHIIVNCHHLAEQFHHLLADTEGVHLQDEEMILGTGGGLRRTLELLDDAPLLVVNGDTYHTIDYGAVYRQHCEQKSAVSLVMHDCPRFNTVAVDAERNVTGFAAEKGCPGKLAFTGIHVINPEVLQLIKADTFSSIIDCYRLWMNSGSAVRAILATGHFWTDIGTPADYLRLHEDLLTGKVKAYSELETRTHDRVYTADTALIEEDVEIKDWAVIGSGAWVGRGAKLSRVVVWDHAVVEAGAEIAGRIIT